MIYHTDYFPSRTVSSNGKTYRYFGGTAYLGLATLPEFRNILTNNIQQYGTGYAASRKANVRLTIYEKAETAMADLVGSEAALSVSSGFLAGQLVLRSFPEASCAFFHAPNTHPALTHPRGKQYASYDKLVEDVRNFAARHPDKTPVVLCDSVTPEQNLYEHNWYEELPADRTVFIADDSHGLGIMGAEGAGIHKKLRGVPFRELLVCGSMSKGFGIQAGAVFASDAMIRRLWKHDIFAGASPASPAMLATFEQALHLYDRQRDRLSNNLSAFDKGISYINVFNRIQGHPAYGYNDESLTRYLLDKGFITTSFPYPDAQSPPVQRIVISAYHTGDDIADLCDTLRNY